MYQWLVMFSFKPRNSPSDISAVVPPASQDAFIDELLAAVLRGEASAWPVAWADQGTVGRVADRAIYHGIAALLIERSGALTGWPDAVKTPLMDQARGQAMWEMRHRIVISGLLASLKSEGIDAVVLKGTALAYDLYANPATRARGDTDLLIERANLVPARQILEALEFKRVTLGEGPFGDIHLQEVWRRDCSDGMAHDIDLHWQTMNAPALEGLLSFADCIADPLALPRLCEAASTMDRGAMLLHLCLHRAAHVTNPYYVDGIAYYGGDRLIWAQDIHLVAGALANSGWAAFCQAAECGGVAGLCLDTLKLVRTRLGTAIPGFVLEQLAAAPQASRATNYMLNSGRLEQTLSDIRALPGLRRKLAYAGARILPSGAFMRAKYPGLDSYPLPLLYLWRVAQWLRKSLGRGGTAGRSTL